MIEPTIQAASSGVPSWNLMPGRALMVHSVKRALGVMDWQSRHSGRPSVLGITRFSIMV